VKLFRKATAALLSAAILISLASCAKTTPEPKPTAPPTEAEPTTPPSSAHYTEDGRRIITIGTWQDIYYVSKHADIYDDASVPQPDGTEEAARRIDIAERRLKTMREIEEKYNVVLEYVNLTFEGIQESVKISIPEGMPDVDIYQVDSQFGIPAVLVGSAMALEDIGLAGTDVFGAQKVAKGLKLEGQDKTYLFNQSNSGGTSAYPLAFNLDMILAAGLENPQDMFDRGEWTWEAWRHYLRVLTKDLDDNGTPDIYGYGGYWTNMLGNLLMSNGAGIAMGAEQTLGSKETREVLQLIYDIYNTDKTARPWDAANWEINNKLYAEGLSAFWIGADWILSEQGGANLPFEVGVVPWPCGPSGDVVTNSYSAPDSTWYMIPKGAEDAELIYNVIFDWMNWYDFDLGEADDRDWSREQYGSVRNFDYAVMMSQKQGFDLWDSLSKTVGFSIVNLMSGALNPAGLIEEFALPYQEALDTYFAK
jgi:hypothetical protein